MDFDSKKRKFTFRCEDCSLILSAEFEQEKDIQDIHDNLLWLECPCGARCMPLRD